jgi:hypothetical protein
MPARFVPTATGVALGIAVITGGALALATGAFGLSDDRPPSTTTGAAATTSTSAGVTVPAEDRPSTTPVTSTTTAPNAPAAAAGTVPTTSLVGGDVTYPVLDAGHVTVRVEGAQLRVVDAAANAGWRAVVERSPAREVEVSFRAGTARVDFNAELEDGTVRVRVDDGRTGATAPTPTAPAPTGPAPSLPSPTVPTVPTSGLRTIRSAGGTVVVIVQGDALTLSAATPAAGFAADVRHSGPDKVEVRFERGDRETRIELEVEGGRLREDVRDR